MSNLPPGKDGTGVATKDAAAAGSKGVMDFFRKRRKSGGGPQAGGPLAAVSARDNSSVLQPDAVRESMPSENSDVKSLTSEASTAQHKEYGHYHTVSASDARVLRAALAKERVPIFRPSESKGRRNTTGPGVRFAYAKNQIVDDKTSEKEDRSFSSVRSDSKSLRDMLLRRRNRSGPSAGIAAEAKLKSDGVRMRNFLVSFRSRPRSVSVSYAPVDPSTGNTCAAPFSGGTAAVQTVGKKKKFKVTSTTLLPSLKRSEPPRIGPEDFVEMYCRSRTMSDPRSDAILKAKVAAKLHKQVVLTQQQQQQQQPVRESSSASLVAGGRRRSDPALHDIDMLKTSGHTYSTVTGISALRLANYQKLGAQPPYSEGQRHSSRVIEPVRMIIWKDKKKGTKVFKLPGYYETYLGSGSEELVFVRFVKSRICYDVMPFSSKLVVFDTQLKVKKAFLALVQNGVRAAVLWDSRKQDFVGMLTVTDFIMILYKYYRSPEERIHELEEQNIATWRDVLDEDDRPLVSVSPSDLLFDAICHLSYSKVHRLLVVNSVTGNALHVLTYRRILQFIHVCLRNLPQNSFLRKTLSELRLGTYEDIVVATPTTPLIKALRTFVTRRVSALPVVDSDGRICDIYTKHDVMDLISDKAYNNLDVSIAEVLKSRHEDAESLQTCKMSDSLFDVLEKIVATEAHRLVVIDNDRQVEGIVSLSDLFQFLVILPYNAMESTVSVRGPDIKLMDEPPSLAASQQTSRDQPSIDKELVDGIDQVVDVVVDGQRAEDVEQEIFLKVEDLGDALACMSEDGVMRLNEECLGELSTFRTAADSESVLGAAASAPVAACGNQ